MSINASPYNVKGTGVAVGVCEGEAVGCEVAVGDGRPKEHAKTGKAKAIGKISSLTFRKVVIWILLKIENRGTL